MFVDWSGSHTDGDWEHLFLSRNFWVAVLCPKGVPIVPMALFGGCGLSQGSRPAVSVTLTLFCSCPL